MPRFTLIPAYGRDYKSKKAVQADLDANVDFINASFDARGRYINRGQLLDEGVATVNIRYGNLRKVGIFPIKSAKVGA
jgi:hypothetical protein